MAHNRYAIAMGCALATIAAIYTAESALGINGPGSPVTKRIEVVIFAGLLLGSLAVRLRARPMASVLAAAAAGQALAGFVAIGAGLSKAPGSSVAEILVLNGMFAAMFAGSAKLFFDASRRASLLGREA